MSVGRLLVGATKIGIAIGLLVWLFRSGRLDFSAIADVESNWVWLLAACALYGVVQLMTAVRWRWLLLVANQDCSIMRAFFITLTSILFNQVLIGSTGGDIYRVMAFDVEGARQRIAIGVSVAMDRLVGLYGLVVLIPVAALWNGDLVSGNELLVIVVFCALAAAVAVPALVWLFFRRGRDNFAPAQERVYRSNLARWLGYGAQGLSIFADSRSVLVRATLFSVVIQFLIITVNLFLAIALLGPVVNYSAMFLLVPVALLVIAVPINPPGAIGTGEAAYSLLLDLAGISQGSVISILQRGLHFIWSVPGALFLAVSPTSPAAVASQQPTQNMESDR